MPRAQQAAFPGSLPTPHLCLRWSCWSSRKRTTGDHQENTEVMGRAAPSPVTAPPWRLHWKDTLRTRSLTQGSSALKLLRGRACIFPCGLEKAIQCVDKREYSIVYLNTCVLSAMLGRRSSRSHQMLSYSTRIFERAESWEMSSETLEQRTVVKE